MVLGVLVVEPAGIEPASASPLQAVLHTCSGRLVLTRCTPAGQAGTRRVALI